MLCKLKNNNKVSAPSIKEVSIFSDTVGLTEAISIQRRFDKDSLLNPSNYSCVISYIANADDNDDSGMSSMDMVALVHRRKEKLGHHIPAVLDND